MKRELFFLILLIVGVAIWVESKQYWNIPTLEGFQVPAPAGASPGLNIPKPNPQPAALARGDPQPFAPPSSALLAPPPGQTASVNSYPPTDPAAQKVPLKRVKEVREAVYGFLANESSGLNELGDPNVQLPLQTARADLRRLDDELAVLVRNPGLQSTLTQLDMNQIEANLGYLQKKWRLSANNMGLKEGFQITGATGVTGAGTGTTGAPYGPMGIFGVTGAATGATGAYATGPATMVYATNANVAGPGLGGTGATGATGGAAISKPASLSELKDLVVRISAEIVRLQSSGTLDPIVSQRVSLLESTRAGINEIIRKLETGQMTPDKVPITEQEYFQFLPIMSNINSPLPDLLKGAGISSAINNLFPIYGVGDVSGAQLSRELLGKYAGDFLKNLSWDVRLKYTGESERKIAEELVHNLGKSQFGIPNPNSELLSSPPRGDAETNGPAGLGSGSRGMFDSIVNRIMGGGSGGETPTHNSGAAGSSGTGGTVLATAATAAPGSGGGAAQRLDWKERSRMICEQITKRGLNAYDYGCMKNTGDVGENFSFRGYARMICNRLSTNYDPGIPTLCGCPPPTWPGWRP